jgi:murein DD-endopeptidase MepM/ murein hydrolase activator NlpD
LASEVSIAFGIKRQFEEGTDLMGEGLHAPGYHGPLNQFDFLQQVALASGDDGAMWQWLENTTPSMWPAQGRLSSSFGMRMDPFLGEGAFHSGVDVAAPQGTPVVATADGVVSSAGWFARYGKRVVLVHGRNDLSTLYAHLSDLYVRPGQVVRRGEVIGRIGRTGRATSSNLHYEVRLRGTAVNPYKFLDKQTPKAVAGFALSD